MDNELEKSKPFINEAGLLVIKNTCDNRYKWWQSDALNIEEILIELKASKQVWQNYVHPSKKDKYPL